MPRGRKKKVEEPVAPVQASTPPVTTAVSAEPKPTRKRRTKDVPLDLGAKPADPNPPADGRVYSTASAKQLESKVANSPPVIVQTAETPAKPRRGRKPKAEASAPAAPAPVPPAEQTGQDTADETEQVLAPVWELAKRMGSSAYKVCVEHNADEASARQQFLGYLRKAFMTKPKGD